jgi:Receptor family ligand binding region
MDEVRRQGVLPPGYELDLMVAETYGQEEESILQTARLWTQNISAYIGPQETCIHEARMAAAFRLPMISYVSSDSIYCFLICILKATKSTNHVISFGFNAFNALRWSLTGATSLTDKLRRRSGELHKSLT